MAMKKKPAPKRDALRSAAGDAANKNKMPGGYSKGAASQMAGAGQMKYGKTPKKRKK